jgi:ComF family protein
MEKLNRLAAAPCCDACAWPLPYERAPCPYCGGRGIGPIKEIASLGLFAEPLRLLIHRIKYHTRWSLAEQLADRLLEQERVRKLLGATDVLVPVPLHRLRQISRGYNQAAVIAARLAGRCGLKVAHPVVRLKQTHAQTHLHSRLTRERNLRDAFGLVRPKTVRGLRVAIVDDVMTSAATLRAVARTLRRAHPGSLAAVVLAVADPRGRGFETV